MLKEPMTMPPVAVRRPLTHSAKSKLLISLEIQIPVETLALASSYRKQENTRRSTLPENTHVGAII
jgi:hypothetical protein